MYITIYDKGMLSTNSKDGFSKTKKQKVLLLGSKNQ